MNSTEQIYFLKMLMESKKVAYLGVVEPLDFDMTKAQVKFSNFSFVFCSNSKDERDQIMKICQRQYEKSLKKVLTTQFLRDLRVRIRKVLSKPSIGSFDNTEFISVYFDLAYYTAVSQKKEAHLKCFTTIVDERHSYYCIVSSKDIDKKEVLKKVREKQDQMLANRLGNRSFLIMMSRY